MCDKVKVAVRVRPLNRREEELGTQSVVNMQENRTILQSPSAKNNRKSPKSFTYDHCFDSHSPSETGFASQDVVFQHLGQDILDNAFKGYNACIFAYGQTGSGKSYTMMGSNKEPGIIPRLCNNLFKRIGEVSGTEEHTKVEVSYMEIYNERVHDLLDLNSSNKSGLKVRENKVLGPYVDGLSQLAVVSFQEINDLMVEGNKSRTVASTNMNNESSRSHAVFTLIITFTLKDPVSGVTGEKVSRVSLVDLAGSERAVKTGAVGERLREGSNINRSLTTLGLVISKLAEEAGDREKFVPYRDSVLTWLLKDNLGGNSRTVMVATISPAGDSYEETLSTLRYADRAKKIINHAVVNEDPNARIIRELRAEVEALKEMLLHAAQPALLKEKLSENEKLMEAMSLTWEEKLHNTEQKQEDRRHALEKMGISVQSSGIKVEKNKYFLVNLNADPSLNELLVYYLKDSTLVGRSDSPRQQDIQLLGLGIQEEHCRIDREGMDLFLSPLTGARTCVNGSEITEKTRLSNGDRILWGSNHFFRVNCPKSTNCEPTPTTPFDWRMAQEEVMMAEVTHAPMREAIARLEKQYEVDKKNALENQRKEYEKQFQQLKNYMSPSTPLAPILQYDPFRPGKMVHSTSVMSRLEKWGREQDDSFKQGLAKLREAILMANGLVREANFLAEEMGQLTSFSVTLQIPPNKLTPNRKLGTFISEAAILVRRKMASNQVWSVEKLEMKLIDMREVYEEVRSRNLSYSTVGESLPDPFYESKEQHNLIGVANIFLEVLFHDVKLDYQTPIISQQGEVSGRLHIEIEKTGGSMGMEEGGRFLLSGEDEASDNHISCRLTIKAATGLPPSLSQFVFCQYSFPGEGEIITVPPSFNPNPKTQKTPVDFKFGHTREFSLVVTEELMEHCADGAVSIEVYGHSSATLMNAWEAEEQRAKATSLADRWAELTRQLKLSVQVQELDETGEYTPVEVIENDNVATGGVLQLKQGQQRRIAARVETIQKSGTLPLICESIHSIAVGSPCVRNKLQRPLDSYQEDDLTNLREKWSELLDKRREYLNSQIQQYINKLDKSEVECEREVSLVDQWVHLTDERNVVIAPSPGSGIPGAPHPPVFRPPPGMERHSTVLFLDLNADDFSTGFSGADYEIPVYGHNSILPKELSGKFFNLPIIAFSDEGSTGATASWDSSIHESTYLNRITHENETVYVIIKVVVRLSHPAPLDLVLRKRLCLSVVKRQSIKEKIKKTLGRSNTVQSVGVIYEIVSNVPAASAELEDRKSLAVIAASGQEVESDTGETFIERYSRGVAAVDTILFLDRLRQNVAVKEALRSQGKSNQVMRKTVSVPNFSNVMKGSQSAENLASLPKIKTSMSVQDFNQEGSRIGRRLRTELETVPEGGESDSIVRPTFLNLGSAINNKLESEKISPNQNNPKKISRMMVHNKENIENKDFQLEVNPKGLHQKGKVSSSQTLENLTELPRPPCTPSLNSSGYGSQAVSSNTLSSEDSLSVNSISVDETPDHEQAKLSVSIPADVSSLLSPPDVSVCSISPGEDTDLTVTETTPSSVIEITRSTEDASMSDSVTSLMSCSATSLGSQTSEVLTETKEGKCGRRTCLSEENTDWLKLGESVQIRPSNNSGVVAYIGPTEFAPGTWVGVELDTTQGKNDGAVKGTRYFTCPPKRGVFVKPKNLKLDKRGRDVRQRKKNGANSLAEERRFNTKPSHKSC